jgi:hypothetical protein
MKELKLTTGRSVSLQFLKQFRVYEGLLEGLPTRQMNQRFLESLRKEARELLPSVEPYLVPAIETPIDWGEDRKYPFGDPARLPRVACIARFSGSGEARDDGFYSSQLVVVWLQEEFAFPIDPGVLEHLQALDWERLAGYFEY